MLGACDDIRLRSLGRNWSRRRSLAPDHLAHAHDTILAEELGQCIGMFKNLTFARRSHDFERVARIRLTHAA